VRGRSDREVQPKNAGLACAASRPAAPLQDDPPPYGGAPPADNPRALAPAPLPAPMPPLELLVALSAPLPAKRASRSTKDSTLPHAIPCVCLHASDNCERSHGVRRPATMCCAANLSGRRSSGGAAPSAKSEDTPPAMPAVQPAKDSPLGQKQGYQCVTLARRIRGSVSRASLIPDLLIGILYTTILDFVLLDARQAAWGCRADSPDKGRR
jgi:hypothetical protein